MQNPDGETGVNQPGTANGAGAAAAGQRVLLTGATGYVGGRLLPLLEQAGVRVRCLARRPESLRSKVGPQTEVVAGDVFDEASLERALAGI